MTEFNDYVSVSATPWFPDSASPTITSTKQTQAYKTVKVASTDLIMGEQDFPIELATQMVIEDMGALELINTARHDLITGNNISYKPFSQMSIMNSRYNPLKILELSDGTPIQFGSFPISLNNYVPKSNPNNVYFDATKENIILEFINIKEGEFIEIEILSQGEVYNDTI
jgi:hypothetical protein